MSSQQWPAIYTPRGLSGSCNTAMYTKYCYIDIHACAQPDLNLDFVFFEIDLWGVALTNTACSTSRCGCKKVKIEMRGRESLLSSTQPTISRTSIVKMKPGKVLYPVAFLSLCADTSMLVKKKNIISAFTLKLYNNIYLKKEINVCSLLENASFRADTVDRSLIIFIPCSGTVFQWNY